jgi:hypothetical protein
MALLFTEGGSMTKWKRAAAVLAVLCLGLFCGHPMLHAQAPAKAKPKAAKAVPAEPKITVLNPLGTPPPIKLKTMAPRLNSLDGKTIYIVDDGFVGGDNLLLEMQDWFGKNYPNTKIVFKRKGGGGFDVEDKPLWAEIKEKANGVIIGLGH